MRAGWFRVLQLLLAVLPAGQLCCVDTEMKMPLQGQRTCACYDSVVDFCR